jgi:hypothetical protein
MPSQTYPLRDDLLRARIASFTSEDLLTVNAGTTITHETAGLLHLRPERQKPGLKDELSAIG